MAGCDVCEEPSLVAHRTFPPRSKLIKNNPPLLSVMPPIVSVPSLCTIPVKMLFPRLSTARSIVSRKLEPRAAPAHWKSGGVSADASQNGATRDPTAAATTQALRSRLNPAEESDRVCDRVRIHTIQRLQYHLGRWNPAGSNANK